MSKPIVIRPLAERDLVAARDWYEAQRSGLGREFLDAVGKVFQRIVENPQLHAIEYRQIRRAGLRRFPYVVYYRFASERVEVLAVLHGGRDPRAWQVRK